MATEWTPEKKAAYQARAAAAEARQRLKNPEWYAAVSQSNLSELGKTQSDVIREAREGAASDAAARAIEQNFGTSGGTASMSVIPGTFAATSFLGDFFSGSGFDDFSFGLDQPAYGRGGGWGEVDFGNIFGAIPAGLAALGVTIPGWLGTAVTVAGTAYGAWQALGGGEGEGLFGINLLGGDDMNGFGTEVTEFGGKSYLEGIPLEGPGLAEPPAAWVLKEWHVSYPDFRLQYYLVQMPRGGRRIAVYNTKTKAWKSWPWRKPHLAVIGKNMPSHKQLTRLRRNLKRHTADAKTVLRLVSPNSLATPKRRRR